MNSKNLMSILISILSSLFILSSCDGITLKLPEGAISQKSTTDDENISKILDGIDDLKNRIEKLEKATGNNVSSLDTSTTKNASISTSNITTENTPKTTETTTSSTETADKKEDAKAQGRKILDKLLSNIKSANTIEALVTRYETGLNNGKKTENKLQVYARKPRDIKAEVLDHTIKDNVGIKIFYSSDDGDITVRPSGALSLITAKLKMTDKQMISDNGYTVADTDFYGIAKRLGDSSYEAELVGKSNVEGTEIFLLKITTKGTNSLDPKIKYEHIGFDQATYTVRLWEIFDGSGNEPFMKLVIHSIQLNTPIPDKNFKV